MNRIWLSIYSLMFGALTTSISAQTQLTKPVVLPATNVTLHGFTANWESVENAEAYCVFVYTEHTAQNDETFTVLHEDFDNITFGNIGDPVWSDELYETLDMYTSLPNWSVYGYTTYVKGMVGGIVYTPYIDLRNDNGRYTVTLSVYGESGDEIFIESDGTKEEKQSFVLKETGINTHTFTFTNGRQDTFFHMHNTKGNEFYIDDVKVTQDLSAGDKAYVYVDLNDAVMGENTSVDFKKLSYAPDADVVYYDLYAVVREYNDPENPDRYVQVYSPFSDKMQVVLNPEATGIGESLIEGTRFSTTSAGVEISLCETSDVKVFDIAGRVIFSERCAAGNHSINLSKGIYVLNIGNNTYKINI